MFSDLTKLARLNAFSPEEGLAAELHKTKNVLKCVYDFASLGGAVSTIGLVDDLGNPAILPAGALVTKSWVDVITPATSGGSATVALKSEAAADLLAATAVASVTGFIDGKADGTAAHFVKTTVARQVSATIAVAALTAGKFNAYVEYVM